MSKVIIALTLWALLSGCGSNSSAPAEKAAAPAAKTAPPAQTYDNMLVRRPGNSAEDGKVYLVRNGKKRWVVSVAWLTAQGFKFPGDVHQIPAADLDGIETGDPIQ